MNWRRYVFWIGLLGVYSVESILLKDRPFTVLISALLVSTVGYMRIFSIFGAFGTMMQDVSRQAQISKIGIGSMWLKVFGKTVLYILLPGLLITLILFTGLLVYLRQK